MNNNKKIWLIPAGAFAALMLVAGVSMARGPGFLGGKDDARAKRFVNFMVSDMLDELDATDVQREEVDAIKERLMSRGFALKAQREGTKKQVLEILQSDRPDAERLHKIVDEQSAQMTKLGHEVADAALELHDVLDDEQREQLAERIAKHRRRH
jgi:Spy/CpxP family protein refolding chaperone